MKGIILAGGLGTRLYPLTKIMNKHVMVVYDRPMFFWPLQTIIKSGIKEIAVVSGPPHGHQVKKLISEFPLKSSIKIQFIAQPKPAGMPDAIYQCKAFAKDSSVIVSAADNIYGQSFSREVSDFDTGALSFLRKVADPERYAVPLYKNGKLKKIEEKPKKPRTSFAVTGPHIFDHTVFEKITKLRPSSRGELEISELYSLYIKENSLKLRKRNDFWLDVGTFDSLLTASIQLKKRKKS